MESTKNTDRATRMETINMSDENINGIIERLKEKRDYALAIVAHGSFEEGGPKLKPSVIETAKKIATAAGLMMQITRLASELPDDDNVHAPLTYILIQVAAIYEGAHPQTLDYIGQAIQQLLPALDAMGKTAISRDIPDSDFYAGAENPKPEKAAAFVGKTVEGGY